MREPQVLMTGAASCTIMETLKTLSDFISEKRRSRVIEEQYGADAAQILSDAAAAVCGAWDAYVGRLKR